MAVRSGDIRQLLIKSREFDVQGGADVTITTGKFASENGVTGNGKVHAKLMRKKPGFSGCPIFLDEIRGDQEFFDAILAAGLPVAVSITTAQNVTYTGSLFPELGEDWGKGTGEGVAEIAMYGESFKKF